MVSLSCCYVRLIVGHPMLPRCKAVIVSEQLCRGFWRKTSCLVHLAQERGVYSARVCVCTHCSTTVFWFPCPGCISFAITLTNERKAFSNLHRHEKTFYKCSPSLFSVSLFSVVSFFCLNQQDLPLSWEGWRPRDIKLWRPVLSSHNSINSLTDNWLLIKFC